MKRWRSNSNGFTLVELLIVVGIMAVLGAVAVAALTGLIGTGTPEAKATEMATVQTAVDAHMSVTRVTTITPRTIAAVITSTDTDAPFKTYIRSLPTKYTYSWLANGTVTQP